MAFVIKKNNTDGMAITRVGTSFPKNSTFDRNFDYVIVQNGKIVGSTGGYRVSSEKAVLNKKCFPELKTPLFGAIKADIYAMGRSIELTPRIEQVEIHEMLPKDAITKTEVMAHFRAWLSVNESAQVYRKLIEMPGGTSYSVVALKGVFRDLARDTISLMLKNKTNRPAKLPISSFTKEGSEGHKFFEEFAEVMKARFKDIGYNVTIVKA